MAPIDATKTQMVVGERLRLLRKAANKELNEAAKGALVSPDTLAKIEDGNSNFRILTITKLCNYYHVTLEDLMNDPGPELQENGCIP